MLMRFVPEYRPARDSNGAEQSSSNRGSSLAAS
jgi:hypothetical protein